MKNLKTSNCIGFRDISHSFHLRRDKLNMTNLGYAKVSNNFLDDTIKVLLRRSKIFVIKNISSIISSVGAIQNGDVSVGNRINRIFYYKNLPTWQIAINREIKIFI